MANTYNYTLPVTGAQVTFREPRNADRRKVLNDMKPNERMSSDEILAAYCITAINGERPQDPDYRYRLDPLPLKDTQAYVELFLSMFTLDNDEMKGVHAEAKKLLGIDSETNSESTSAQS